MGIGKPTDDDLQDGEDNIDAHADIDRAPHQAVRSRTAMLPRQRLDERCLTVRMRTMRMSCMIMSERHAYLFNE